MIGSTRKLVEVVPPAGGGAGCEVDPLVSDGMVPDIVGLSGTPSSRSGSV